MIVINGYDVRFESAIKDPVNHQPKFLEYLSNIYQLISYFPLSQKAQAAELWSDLTDHSDTICLLVQQDDSYSIWGLTEQSGNFLNSETESLNARAAQQVIGFANWLGHALWLVIIDLAGADRAQSFEADVINSHIPIPSWAEVAVAPSTPSYWDEKLDSPDGATWQLVVDEFQTLTAKYVGKSFAQQIIQDITAPIFAHLPCTD